MNLYYIIIKMWQPTYNNNKTGISFWLGVIDIKLWYPFSVFQKIEQLIML